MGEEPAVRLALPGPRIGRLDLQLRYAVPHEKLAPTATTSVTVPLVMPGLGKLGHNQLRVLPQAGILAKLRKGPWTAEANSDGECSGNASHRALQVVSELPLAIELKQRPSEGKTDVECGWIQTVLVGGTRHDRVLYRFRSGERQLRLALPSGATRTEVLLDGNTVPVVEEALGEILVPLAAGDENQHLLDLSYSLPWRSSAGRLEADPPQVRPAPRMRRLYWELIMPATDHLLLAPADFTSEYSWMLRWAPCRIACPSLDQPELEQLLGVAGTSPRVSQGNRYLFSTVGSVQPQTLFWWAPRSIFVFGASARLLAVGLALIYFPRLRHPAAIFVPGRGGLGRHAGQS